MTPSLLTHIVPALPPQIDGVGDYALNLARHLRDLHGIDGRFIVCDPDWDGPSRIEGFVVRRLRLRNEAGIWSLLGAVKENPSVILHYVGYGYQKRGVPLWLYRGIKSWLMDRPGHSDSNHKQFATVFHELWTSSRQPWRSAFYLQMMQRMIAEGLHRQSTFSVTSTRRTQAVLDSVQVEKTTLLPIPSNIPYPQTPVFHRRNGGGVRVAIFGQRWSRFTTINAHANLLRHLEKTRGLDSVVLIGKGLQTSELVSEETELLQSCVSRQRIKVLGELSPQEVSTALANADLYLSPYEGEFACKSGAFMAAAANGCPAILRDGRNSNPLRDGEHFLASDDSDESVARVITLASNGELPRIAEAAHAWYHSHADWKVIAHRFQELIRSTVGKQSLIALPSQRPPWVVSPVTPSPTAS